MSAVPPWPRGVPSLAVPVPCSGAVHTVLWRRGALVLVDHDPVADGVLVALGGESPACLDLRASWRLGYIEEEPPAVSAGLVRSLSSLASWMGAAGSRPVLLPEPLRRMREVSLLRTWGRGLREASAGAASQGRFLERALVRRVRDLAVAQLRAACGSRWSDDDVVVEVVEGGAASAVGAATATEAHLHLVVPTSWLAEVWVPGLEACRGGLVLEAFPPGSRARSVAVARWSADGAGGWELRVTEEPRET